MKTNEYLYIDPSVAPETLKCGDLEDHDFYKRTSATLKRATQAEITPRAPHGSALIEYSPVVPEWFPDPPITNVTRTTRSIIQFQVYQYSKVQYGTTPGGRISPALSKFTIATIRAQSGKARSMSAQRTNCATSMAPRRTARWASNRVRDVDART